MHQPRRSPCSQRVQVLEPVRVLEQLRVLEPVRVLEQAWPFQLALLAQRNHRSREQLSRVSRTHHASSCRRHSSRLHQKRSSSCEFLVRQPKRQKLQQQ